ncbi:nucleotidyl transferase AbiEii/AbiGii toxin family protein [Anaeromyxobacter sp. Fw109-5]|uniref:nucleotidyl transferase AbiEii/AbiGii toxin family protein n=1 Tax=Anaeromyxobacter sp. (strain Fw109-5) TaxID=404589 RepID=UPI00059D3DAA|nr:nucleotidyl transferase AbiEii/AbiGii toxin family protein [Anaeromyxobacter sp. Fw109-5]
MSLPPLPDRALLADLCREAAAREGVEPQLVEKDFYLTRLLWALGQHFGDALLLKGGTLLSKVDLGFFRMSEDADLVLPGTPSRRSSKNIARMHAVRKALADVLAPVGMTARFPAGQLQHQAAHGTWQLDYASEFGPQGIMLEISIRPVLRPPREVRLRQLLADKLLGDPGDPRCFALDAREAHAEKVRAAFTREAIRDFYDLDRLLEAGADLSSAQFVELVDAKLAELKASPLIRQGRSFGLDANRLPGVPRPVQGRADADAVVLEEIRVLFGHCRSRASPATGSALQRDGASERGVDRLATNSSRCSTTPSRSRHPRTPSGSMTRVPGELHRAAERAATCFHARA